MTRDRTTSATPVSHVFPGRRAEVQAREKMSAANLRYAHAQTAAPTYAGQMEVVRQVRSSDAGLLADLAAHQTASRTPYKPSTPQTAPNHPDCVCAAYGALGARLRGIEERLDDYHTLLCIQAAKTEKLEARLQALEVSGEGERG